MMNTVSTLEYDVVIMGAGFAGLCQARHLLLKIPHLKIALIDPRPEDRTEQDQKIGESTVEMAALLIGKELGLYDYMIDNHPPKMGLNFHWSKQPDQTKTIDDYYHIWINRQPPIPTFQMHRPKFERDLLKMNKEMGITFYNGKVVDVDLTPKDQPNGVKVKLNSGEYLELSAKHLIDTAGRQFIIGKKTNNVLFDSQDLQGVKTGSAWVRVKNIDRSIFHKGYDPDNSVVSHYYATNHFFGPGHWLWMIPIDTDSQEVSLGVIHHHDVIEGKQVNTVEKFKAFLKANHTLLSDLIDSGELVDFHYWPRVAHSSKTLFSEDNWYVMGDSACIFDAFYSLGTSMIAVAIDSVTEIIRSKLANEPNAEEKRAVYNEFNLTFIGSVNIFVSQHTKQLGHASIMSWRIYFEYMWWFGILVPMYLGKWHLDVNFIREFTGPFRNFLNGLIPEVYQQFNELVDRKANIGLMDAIRADQLIGHYFTFQHFDDYLENAKLEPQRCNISGSMKYTLLYVAIWYIKFQWKGFGLKGLFNLRHLSHITYLLALSGLSALGELKYKFQTHHLPNNSEVARMREEFQSYQYQPELQPWLPRITEEVVIVESDSKTEQLSLLA